MQEERNIRVELLEKSSVFPDRTEQFEHTEKAHESEGKWLLLKNPHDVVLNLDRDGTILFINPTLPGFTIEDTIGKTIYDFIPSIQHKKIRKAIKEVFKTGEVVSFETSLFGPDGSLLRYSTHLSPVKNCDKVVCVAQVFINITKRKKAKEETKKYKTISDRAGYGTAMSDLKGNLTYVNDSFARMHGYKKVDELIGKNLSVFHNAEQIENVNRLNTQLIRQGNYVAEEVWHTRKDGTTFPALMNGTLIRSEKGEPLFLAYTIIDITDRNKAKEQLTNTNKRLEYILATSPVTTYMCEAGGNWAATFISENFRDQFDYEPNQFVEDQNFWVEHVHPDDRQRIIAGLSRIFEDDFHVHEYRFLHKDGSYRWVHDETRLIRDEQGKPLECIGYWTDITERKKAEQHLKILDAAIASSINAVAIADIEGNLTYVNNSFLKMWGYKNDKQILGKPAVKFWQLEERASKVVDVLRNKESWIGELTTKRKDGSTFYVQLSASSVIDENGELICMMGSFMDITERKRFMQAIRQSEKRYRTLVESAGETIATINEDGVFLFINKTGAERLGGKPEDFIGKTMWDLFPKKIADRQADGVRKVINTGKERNVVALTELQGLLRWNNTSIVPFRDSDGKATTAMVIARDIHESKRREEELNIYQEKMARVEQLTSLGTLGATLAHELTQPLTVIRLSIQNSLAELETMSCPSTVVEDLKKGLSGISSVISIIGRFRNFARISSEKTVKIVDLREIAERTVELLDENAWRAKVTLQVKGMDILPPIYSHKKDLERLYFSLVENSIQAADGKKSRQVIISSAIRDGHIELQFSDNCGGIAPENLKRIFEPFFTTKNVSERTGLGLCVVERIVSQLGGKVRVESKLGKGSTFFVTLPIKGEQR